MDKGIRNATWKNYEYCEKKEHRYTVLNSASSIRNSTQLTKATYRESRSAGYRMRDRRSNLWWLIQTDSTLTNIWIGNKLALTWWWKKTVLSLRDDTIQKLRNNKIASEDSLCAESIQTGTENSSDLFFYFFKTNFSPFSVKDHFKILLSIVTVLQKKSLQKFVKISPTTLNAPHKVENFSK